MADLKAEILKECERIIEDTLFSEKGHYFAASRFFTLHTIIGIIATILAAAAGASALAKIESTGLLAGLLSSVAAVLTACTTFIKPNDRASGFQAAGHKYNAIRNDARIFLNINSARLTDDQCAKVIEELNSRKLKANASSPQIPRFAFKKAKKAIEEDLEAEYAVDKIA